jgi:hypothetical protein
LTLASCGGNGGTSASTQISAGSTVQPATAGTSATTANDSASAIQIAAIDAPKDGATVCGNLALSVKASGVGRMELQNESGKTTLGRFNQGTNGSEWTLTFDPDKVAQDSMFMVRIVAWPASGAQTEVEVARNHWLNTETCPAAEQKA